MENHIFLSSGGRKQSIGRQSKKMGCLCGHVGISSLSFGRLVRTNKYLRIESKMQLQKALIEMVMYQNTANCDNSRTEIHCST